MKQPDSILLLQTQLDLVRKTERQLQLAMPEWDRILVQIRSMEGLFPKIAFPLGLQTDLGWSHIAEELTRAAREVEQVGILPKNPAFGLEVKTISEISAAFAAQTECLFAPLRAAAEEATVQFASQIELYRKALDAVKLTDEKWIRDLQSMSARLAEMAKVTFALPETALLHWSPKDLIIRTPLLEDCIRNMTALEKFYAAAILPKTTLFSPHLDVAGQFVFDHAEVVRRLPPRLPEPEPAQETLEDHRHRDEEIGAKLERALDELDRRLVQLRRQAWGNVSGGIAGARLAMGGIREVFTEVLHMVAPDADVEATALWHNRTDRNITRPTRRMRLIYAMGEEAVAELDLALQFDESVRRTQKFVHTFADDPELVRVHMAQLENWIYLLLLFAKRRAGEN